MTPDAEVAGETENVKWPNSVTVLESAVPASDGGYMGALWEVKGHDYYFLPIEGGKMLIFDLDKFVAGEDPLVDTVDTNLYYPTSATVTKDGKVVVGGDGKRCRHLRRSNVIKGSSNAPFSVCQKSSF